MESSNALSSHPYGGHSHKSSSPAPNNKKNDGYSSCPDASRFAFSSGESALFGGSPGSYATTGMWMGRNHHNKNHRSKPAMTPTEASKSTFTPNQERMDGRFSGY